MFSELRRLHELKRLLRRKKYGLVLERAVHPSIKDHRRALEARLAARVALIQQVREGLEAGEMEGVQDVWDQLLRDGDGPDLAAIKSVFQARRHREREDRERVRSILTTAREAMEEGRVSEALTKVSSLDQADKDVRGLHLEADRRRRESTEALKAAKVALKRKEIDQCLVRLQQAHDLHSDVDGLSGVMTDLLTRAGRWNVRDQGAVLKELRHLFMRSADLLGHAGELAEAHIVQIEKAVRKGDDQLAMGELRLYPLGVAADDRAERLKRGIRHLDRARRALDDGDLQAANTRLESAESVMDGSPGWQRARKDLDKAMGVADPLLEKAGVLMREGQLVEARRVLLDLLDRQPRNREGLQVLEALDAHDQDDLKQLSMIRKLLTKKSKDALNQADSLLKALAIRRSDLQDLDVLKRDLARRLVHLPAGAEARPPVGTKKLAGAEESPSGAKPLFPPLILRLEEGGDWMMLSKTEITLGRKGADGLDLEFLAPLSRRHARLVQDPQSLDWFLEPCSGATCTRNRRSVVTRTKLQHGDHVGLGEQLEMRFLKPSPASSAAVLELERGQEVQGCRRVLLMTIHGRPGGLLMAPSPEAHVPLGMQHDRVELIAGPAGPGKTALFARSPRGVSLDHGPERPQISVEFGKRVQAGPTVFYLDRA